MAEESLRMWNDSFYFWKERRNETENRHHQFAWFRCAEKRRYFEEMATIVCSCCKLEDHPDGASFCLLKLQSHWMPQTGRESQRSWSPTPGSTQHHPELNPVSESIFQMLLDCCPGEPSPSGEEPFPYPQPDRPLHSSMPFLWVLSLSPESRDWQDLFWPLRFFLE